MEPAQETVPELEPTESPQAQLSRLFGSYRAEWLRDHIFELYTSPIYFPELVTGRSCMLEGGRGTGKTTVLRALSWDGQRRLANRPPADWPFYGVYYRANTNRVAALQGPELSTAEWGELFAHYFNLLVSERLLRFVDWYSSEHLEPSASILSPDDCEEIAITLGVVDAVDGTTTTPDLARHVRRARLGFETYINNVVDAPRPVISLQGLPIETMTDALSRHVDFRDKPFFIIVDEYENFTDEQQRVVNTLIKHASDRLAFKIGVRELGWRQRATLNEHEQLRSPADYVRIDISEKLDGVFPEFAARICNERIARLKGPIAEGSLGTVQALFPRLTEDREAELLGVDRHIESMRSELELALRPEELATFDELPKLFRYLFGYWAQGSGNSVAELFRSYLASPSRWTTRYGNYKHALLYTLNRGRRGIQKYYAGHDTVAEVAGTNIRFYLQLVEQTLLAHFQKSKSLSSPVDPADQTRAAQHVGRLNLGELEGLSVFGMYLSRLVLGLGRVFEVMASQPEGHAPEVTQFYIVGDFPNEVRSRRAKLDELPMEVDALVNQSVMHLALVRFSGTKPTGPGDTEEYDYMLHPVFTPLFATSYRRKRKMRITRLQLAGLVRSPRATIRDILASSKRSDVLEDLPDQLRLFEAFYNAGD